MSAFKGPYEAVLKIKDKDGNEHREITGRGGTVFDEDGNYLCLMGILNEETATLIAASWEMLAVLEKVLVGLDGGHLDNCDCLAKSPGTSCENCELLDEVDAIVQKAKSKQ
jgi:hypothetical protein